MSNNESDSDTRYHTPAEVVKAAKAVEENLLSPKSKEKHKTIYKDLLSGEITTNYNHYRKHFF